MFRLEWEIKETERKPLPIEQYTQFPTKAGDEVLLTAPAEPYNL